MPNEVEVGEKDENGVTIIKRPFGPRRLPRDYKMRPPSPLPKILKCKRKAAELEEHSKALRETSPRQLSV